MSVFTPRTSQLIFNKDISLTTIGMNLSEFGVKQTRVFSQVGTHYMKFPAGVTKAFAICVGAGAAGASLTSSSGATYDGGGGGGVSAGIVDIVPVTRQYAIVVGQGGIGTLARAATATPQAIGNSGTLSSFGTQLVAYPGIGGTNNNSLGGIGNIGTGGNGGLAGGGGGCPFIFGAYGGNGAQLGGGGGMLFPGATVLSGNGEAGGGSAFSPATGAVGGLNLADAIIAAPGVTIPPYIFKDSNGTAMITINGGGQDAGEFGTAGSGGGGSSHIVMNTEEEVVTPHQGNGGIFGGGGTVQTVTAIAIIGGHGGIGAGGGACYNQSFNCTGGNGGNGLVIVMW